MKIRILAVVVGIASSGTAGAQSGALEFPRQSIELPSLSLSGAAAEALQSRLPDMTPRTSNARSERRSHPNMVSHMPIKRPDEGVDAKVLIATPDAMKDFKLRVVTPEVESPAK